MHAGSVTSHPYECFQLTNYLMEFDEIRYCRPMWPVLHMMIKSSFIKFINMSSYKELVYIMITVCKSIIFYLKYKKNNLYLCLVYYL